MATGTASGKSVGYLAPALTAVGEGGTALYLAPTRALAADQLSLLRALDGWLVKGTGLGLRPAVIDSDTPSDQRSWARKYADLPADHARTCCTSGCCRSIGAGAGFCAGCATSSSTSAMATAGVFGSHVAQVLRRLRRVAEHHREPGAPELVFILASATISEPARAPSC